MPIMYVQEDTFEKQITFNFYVLCTLFSIIEKFCKTSIMLSKSFMFKSQPFCEFEVREIVRNFSNFLDSQKKIF